MTKKFASECISGCVGIMGTISCINVGKIKHIYDMDCSMDEYATMIQKVLESDLFKKTITINGKTMNVKEFFLDDNIDAVSWYYKRDEYYLTYYKVWEEEAKQGLELIYDISNKTMQCSPVQRRLQPTLRLKARLLPCR